MNRTRPLSAPALLLLAAVAGALPAAACGGKTKQADAPTHETEGMADPSSAPATDAPAPSASSDAPAPLGSLLGGDPVKDQKLFESISAAPAAKVDPKGATAKDPLAKKVAELAKQLAPGMAADGPMFRAKLKEGERARGDVTLKSGMCYAVIGHSDKIVDLDLHLMIAPGAVTAQDTTDDQSPALGKAPEPLCPEKELTYKLGIYAEKGSGEAAVQVYSKKK